jgi:cell division transport system permease protein
MAFRYVLTELRQGLRRNFSMHLAVVITLLVSMTLAGVGYLMLKEADRTRDHLSHELQITIYLCSGDASTSSSQCTARVTPAQKQRIEATLHGDEYVASVTYHSSKDNFEEMKKLLPPENFSGPQPPVTLDKVGESYDVLMSDAHKAEDIDASVKGLPGVDHVQDQQAIVNRIVAIIDAIKLLALLFAVVLLLGALLLVANTVRLAAFARRREISIMRLVGASSVYIMLPFLLEVFVTAVIGGAVAVGGLWAFEKFVVLDQLEPTLKFTTWVDWHDWAVASVGVVVLSSVLTLIPALLMTRRYVKV